MLGTKKVLNYGWGVDHDMITLFLLSIVMCSFHSHCNDEDITILE